MNKGVYIHIPFCNKICSYCDFAKVYYNSKYVEKYLEALKKEILKVYQKDAVDTIYIGGGTPSSLNVLETKKLLTILKIFKRTKDCEITIEVNPESVDLEKLKLYKEFGVNRISVGIETFHPKYLKYLNRDIVDFDHVYKMIRKYFNNINIDLMYAIYGETKDELEEDIKKICLLNPTHISTYSLIIEPHTKLYVEKTKPIDMDLDFSMYEIIRKTLLQNGYQHYETSNFSKPGYLSRHNLKYWHNENYYGFGLGAAAYLGKNRINNTRSISDYINGNYILEIEEITPIKDMSNHMILGLRLNEGVNILEFNKKYQCDIYEVYPIAKLLEEGYLDLVGNNIKISEKYMYTPNNILINFI